MKWLVIEDNPKPDKYVAILAYHIQPQAVRFSEHQNFEAALKRARNLMNNYGVKSIRVFYQDKPSVRIS
ncbi:MAG: hypothetical protein ACLFUB_19340 [Cyclobacteriaceae bacterium]